jgi:DNA-binding GntR family transcriptional regulator
MEGLIGEMEEPVKGSDYESYKVFAAQDAAFHMAVTSSSGVDLIFEMIKRLRPHAQLYRLYYEAGIEADTAHEHQRILDAIASHDAGAADEAMRTHIRAARAHLASAVRED